MEQNDAIKYFNCAKDKFPKSGNQWKISIRSNESKLIIVLQCDYACYMLFYRTPETLSRSGKFSNAVVCTPTKIVIQEILNCKDITKRNKENG